MSDDRATIEISDRDQLAVRPLVSVYMLAYAHERFIAQAIEGVVAQRCDFPIELIVGDDCSPDRTGEIVRDEQRRHPALIRVLTAARNVGAPANARRCLAAARGEFIAICEGDDYWCDPTKLQRQVDILRARPDVSLVCHRAGLVDAATGRASGAVHTAFRSRMLAPRELVLGDGGAVATASIVVRRRVFDARPDWWLRAPVGDYALVLRASMLGKVAYLHRLMSMYRINVPGSWSQRRTVSLERRWQVAEKLDALLRGFDRDGGNRFAPAVRKMASKYYSDALVRSPGDAGLKRRLFRSVARQLTWPDRILAWVAVFTPLRVAALKTLVRKADTALRMARCELRAERLDAAP